MHRSCRVEGVVNASIQFVGRGPWIRSLVKHGGWTGMEQCVVQRPALLWDNISRYELRKLLKIRSEILMFQLQLSPQTKHSRLTPAKSIKFGNVRPQDRVFIDIHLAWFMFQSVHVT